MSPFQFEVRSELPYSLEAAAAVAESAGAAVAEALGVQLCGPYRVVLGPEPSSADGTTLLLQARRDSGGLRALHWLELLIRHELTHVLTRQHWGATGCALLWEGLPVHLGDEHVRRRELGRSYAAHCAALVAAERWIDLTDLLLPSAYYARRTDWRVDVQAGAFVGWVLQRGRRDELRAWTTTCTPPTPDDPVLRLAFDLAGEQAAFLDHLRRLEADPVLVETYQARQPPAPRAPHCDFCMHPRPEPRCAACGAAPGPISIRQV